MFGTSVRSVSAPIRGYVCSSCLARRNTQFPTRRQALRFVSTAPAQSESPSATSDAVLCTISKHPKGKNGDSAKTNSAPKRNLEGDKKSKPAARKGTKGSGKPKPLKQKKVKKLRKVYATLQDPPEKPAQVATGAKVRKVGRPSKASNKQSELGQSQESSGLNGKAPVDSEKLEKVMDTVNEKLKRPDGFNFIGALRSMRTQQKRQRAESSGAPKEGAEGSGGKSQRAKKAVEADSLNAGDLEINPLNEDLPNVPKLSYGLDRVLFNPGVYHLQDPRSRVYNFDPYLGSIMPISEFDFEALNDYITSSKDQSLHDLASKTGKKYVGSSSSMTSVLSHFHYLLSQWREINTSTVSQGFPSQLRSFTKTLRGPAAIFLRYNDGVYAVDADKEFESASVLMNLGKSMEKMLTLSTEDFERYRRTSENKISPQESEPEAYHYSTIGDFVMRSQLDAYDPRLPGTGMFDLKTRAVVSIRMNRGQTGQGLGYQIKGRYGGFESYEREYFDMIRAAFLKYSLQVRIGRMDGIFVAFHNIERIFGFQYISLPEMDHSIHGQDDTILGDSEFKLSMSLWNKILNRATEKFPKQSLRFHFETREAQSPFMYIFAEPVTEDEIHAIQTRRADEIEAVQKKLLHPEATQDEPTPKRSSVEFSADAGNKFQTLEEALGSNTGQDTIVTDSGTVDEDGLFTQNGAQKLDEEDSEAKDITEDENEEYDSKSATDTEFLDGLSKSGGKSKPLLGMTLTISNNVNGVSVVRPGDLGPEDKWTIDYEMKEFTSLARAWTVYEACQKRRSALNVFDEEEGDDKRVNTYLETLNELSAAGRVWRQRQDEIDREYGMVALNLESKTPSDSPMKKTSSSPSTSSAPAPEPSSPSSEPSPSSGSSSSSDPSSSSASASSPSDSASSASSSPSVSSKFFKFFS